MGRYCKDGNYYRLHGEIVERWKLPYCIGNSDERWVRASVDPAMPRARAKPCEL